MEKARAPRFPRSAARAGLLVSLLALLVAASLGAQTQTPLPGSSIPQFVDALPSLNILVAGAAQIELDMKEFQAEVLSTGTLVPGVAPKTWVWGYTTPGQLVFPSYIGPVIVATRGTPTEIKCVNNLGTTATSNLLAYTHSVDQTLHWADPLGGEANTGSMNVIPGQLPLSPWNQNFAGTIPAVPHLHGGEVPPVLDGGPDAWFTSNGAYHGHDFYTRDGSSSNYAIYRYPNTRQAAPIWFHDHTLGATRLNVYAGLAGA